MNEDVRHHETTELRSVPGFSSQSNGSCADRHSREPAASTSAPAPPREVPPAPDDTLLQRYRKEVSGKLNWMFLLSFLAVACWSLAGNACRLALHAAFLRIPFFATYEFFGPNCVGSFVMGLAGALVRETDLPLLQRAITVGFCGSFTTFSSWVVDIANKDTAGHAFEELISGITMPFMFLLWGRDLGVSTLALLRRFRAHYAATKSQPNNMTAAATALPPKEPDGETTTPAKKTYERELLAADVVFLAVSVAAAVAVPVSVQVRINQGHVTTVTTKDMRAVGMAPLGAVPRYVLSVLFNKLSMARGFPVGTLLANALGCLLVVFMDCFNFYRPYNHWYWVVSNGVCGALSTVSSFANETVGFYSAGRLRMAYVYVLVTLAVTITIGAVGRRKNFA